MSVESKKAIEAIMELHPDWGYVKVSKAIGAKRTGARDYMEKIRGKMVSDTIKKKETQNVHSNKIGHHNPKICPICKKDIYPMYKYNHIKRYHPEYKLEYSDDEKGNTVIRCGYCGKRAEGYKEFALHRPHCNQKSTPIVDIPDVSNNSIVELISNLNVALKEARGQVKTLKEKLHTENGNSQKLASYVAEAQRLLAQKE